MIQVIEWDNISIQKCQTNRCFNQGSFWDIRSGFKCINGYLRVLWTQESWKYLFPVIFHSIHQRHSHVLNLLPRLVFHFYMECPHCLLDTWVQQHGATFCNRLATLTQTMQSATSVAVNPLKFKVDLYFFCHLVDWIISSRNSQVLFHQISLQLVKRTPVSS